MEERLEYLEKVVFELVSALEQQKCLDKNFLVSVEAKGKQRLRDFIDDFIVESR